MAPIGLSYERGKGKKLERLKEMPGLALYIGDMLNDFLRCSTGKGVEKNENWIPNRNRERWAYFVDSVDYLRCVQVAKGALGGKAE